MASQYLGYSLLLVAATIGIHGAGTLVIFWMLFRSRMFATRHFGNLHNTTLLMSIVVALMAVHLLEVASWATFYSYKGFFSDFGTNINFSIVTYTTVGYGDVVLRDKEWRLLGGVEALTLADAVLVDCDFGQCAQQALSAPHRSLGRARVARARP